MKELLVVATDRSGAAQLEQHPKFEVLFRVHKGPEGRTVDSASIMPHHEAMPTVAPLLLSQADVARVLALSEAKVKRMVRDGIIPSVTIDRRRLLRREDVEDYVRRLGLPDDE